MLKQRSRSLDATFAALSDPIRRGILERLARGEASVGELAAPFKVTAPAISHHLGVLEGARLVTRSKRGRTHVCKLRPAGMRAVAEWMSRYEAFWTPRLDQLGRHLERSKRR